MTTWLDPGSVRVSTQDYLDHHPLGVVINNYCHGKYQLRITRDFLFLTYVRYWIHFQIFTSKLWVSMTIHDATKSRIICLTKTEGLLPSNSQFLMKRAQQKTPRPDNKTLTNQNHTELKRPNLLFETGHCLCAR